MVHFTRFPELGAPYFERKSQKGLENEEREGKHQKQNVGQQNGDTTSKNRSNNLQNPVKPRT